MKYLDLLKEAIDDYISHLPISQRIYSLNSSVNYSIEEKDYNRAIKSLNEQIELMTKEIVCKHCVSKI